MEAVAANRRVEVHSGHDVGKSFVAADIVLWFLYSFPNSIVITTAPTWRQVEKILWGEINQHWRMSKQPLGGKPLETEIKIGPKWYAMGFSSDSKDAFQGFHADHVLVVEDEPSGIEDEIDEQIQTILANDNTRLLKIGNPVRATGHFAESIKSKLYYHININCWESPNVVAGQTLYPGLVTKQWCEDRLVEWGEDSPVYQSRVLGEVPSENEDVLIKLEWIERAIKRYNTKNGPGNDFKKFPGLTVISCDVARFGDNKTVIIIRTGRRVREILSYSRQDTVQTAQVLDELISQYEPDHVVVDDNGVGGGVVDMLRHKGHKHIVPVNAGEKADESDRYSDRRSELATRVRVAFKRNEIDIPDHECLVFECNNQFFELDKLQRIKVMSKALMRKKGLKSPDFFDALYLSYAREIPASLAIQASNYIKEFEDSVHIQDIDPENFMTGVSRFCVVVPVVNDESVVLWAMADRWGKIYIYKEAVCDRTTSGKLARTIRAVESKSLHVVDERYLPKTLQPDEVSKKRYTFIEQMDDEDLCFEEIEYDPELAAMNIREGLSFDNSNRVSRENVPHIFFHKDCKHAIQAIKYLLNPKVLPNEPLHEQFHRAVGILVLSEPMWLKATEPSASFLKEPIDG